MCIPMTWTLNVPVAERYLDLDFLMPQKPFCPVILHPLSEEIRLPFSWSKRIRQYYENHSFVHTIILLPFFLSLTRLFKEWPHPDEKQRRELGDRLGLAPRQVKFWFQNRRTQIKVHVNFSYKLMKPCRTVNLSFLKRANFPCDWSTGDPGETWKLSDEVGDGEASWREPAYERKD